MHAHVTQGLLISTLVPINKDPMASINISNLTVKLLDWIVNLLGGNSPGLSELQFAYQANSSTSQCTWAALETIDYCMKRDSEVFTVAPI